MPKEIFLNGKLTIEYDQNNPIDARKLAQKSARGKPISTMTLKEMQDLLKVLNDEYNLGLLP